MKGKDWGNPSGSPRGKPGGNSGGSPRGKLGGNSSGNQREKSVRNSSGNSREKPERKPRGIHGNFGKSERERTQEEKKEIDYQSWDFTKREYLEMTGVSLLITVTINVLCYRTLWAFLLFLPIEWFWIGNCRKNKIQKRKEQLYDHFRDLIAWMHTALRSGYSMENAVLEAAGQMEQNFGKEDVLVQELYRMRHKMMLSLPVEQLFQDLAARSRMEDIETFASVLVIAKRTGGNVCEIFQNTWDVFCTRIDTMREIRSSVSARKFEQNIMSVVPFGILMYVQFSFPEFLEVMYGNLTGVLFMTGCLAVYLAAWKLGERILDIEF